MLRHSGDIAVGYGAADPARPRPSQPTGKAGRTAERWQLWRWGTVCMTRPVRHALVPRSRPQDRRPTPREGRRTREAQSEFGPLGSAPGSNLNRWLGAPATAWRWSFGYTPSSSRTETRPRTPRSQPAWDSTAEQPKIPSTRRPRTSRRDVRTRTVVHVHPQ
jgi:hypothetical protein